MIISLRYSFVVLLIAAGAQKLCGDIAKDPPAKPQAPILSEFKQPANPRDGRDPFYPESMRPFESAVAAVHTIDISSLAIKGISGIPGHRLVIINNHTFATGDELDVKSSSGSVHVRCVEIRADSAVIEVNGQKHELNFGVK